MKLGGIILYVFRLYNKATVTESGTKIRNTDKQNRTESPEINPCTYDHL